jgi:ribosomal protein S20
MPIIKSAKKRVKQTRKATARNARTKRSLRSALKSFVRKPSSSGHSKAQSNLDKAAKKGLVHKNKVARKKRQLAKAAKAAGVKHTASAKKATPKKTAAKKAPAKKKTAAKKK